MKKIYTLILFLTCTTLLFSQEKDSLLVGEWKVICMETENYYYNSVNESFHWSKDYETKILPKQIKDYGGNAEEFVASTKGRTLCDRFVFQEDGIYLRKCNTQILRKGNYNINSSEKTIYFKDKDKPEYSMKYSIKKGLLYLTIIFNGNSKLKPTKFILQKVTTS